ncbi:hypothetical protein EON65_06515 [archaeon]|nr:MAG: hypothetical protein EON65_06515 [archaeon]
METEASDQENLRKELGSAQSVISASVDDFLFPIMIVYDGHVLQDALDHLNRLAPHDRPIIPDFMANLQFPASSQSVQAAVISCVMDAAGGSILGNSMIYGVSIRGYGNVVNRLARLSQFDFFQFLATAAGNSIGRLYFFRVETGGMVPVAANIDHFSLLPGLIPAFV